MGIRLIRANRVRTPRFGRILCFPWARLQPPRGKTTAAGSSDTWDCTIVRPIENHLLFPQESSYSAYAYRSFLLKELGLICIMNISEGYISQKKSIISGV